MRSRRDFLGILPAGLFAAGCAASLDAQTRTEFKSTTVTMSPERQLYEPLEELTLQGTGTFRLLVLDGDGKAYVDRDVTLPVPLRIGGALGSHTVLLINAQRELLGYASFEVDARTQIRESSGEYQRLLDTLYWTMATDGPVGARRHNGRVYTYWVEWLLDNTNTMKGMRYFWPEVQLGFEFFSVTQREDGMIWENHIDRTPPENDWDRRFKYGDFSRPADDGFVALRRAPVENHVEMYFLEALYLAWQTTGDDAWMQQHLDRALRAVDYSTSDPYRWSTKYGLLKRGLTIDTWDFLCDSEAAQVHGDIMAIDLHKTHFGIFFGDNTGMIAGCRYLAEMLEQVGRSHDAERMRSLANELEERLNRVSWNGEFYTHWVPEDPEFRPDLGVDMSRQVSLSNAYTLNRGIPQRKAEAIVRSYQAIREEMPSTSPGEFYSIYPPFLKGFGSEQSVWDYVNGGVLACTAGELARGAFHHGFEEYGEDILKRLRAITQSHRDFLPGILRGKEPERESTAFTPLDMTAVANCDTGKGADGVPGWSNEAGNYLIDFPSGTQTFRGVPFNLLSAQENGHRVCIGVCEAHGYAPVARMQVGKPCGSFYLLHAGSGGSSLFGKLTIRYADGTSQVEYIERGVNAGSYWAPEDSEFNNRYGPNGPERLQVAWRGKSEMIGNVGVWIASFAPHKPEAEIAALEFASVENGAKWFVIGVTLSDRKPFLPPHSDVSSGMPNNWGAGCVTAALIEGLAGIEDKSAGYRSIQISPRWQCANVDEVYVSARYPASRGYVVYKYRKETKKVVLDFTSCADDAELRVLLPAGKKALAARLDDRNTALQQETVRESTYSIAKVVGRGVHRLEVDLSG